MGVVEGEEEGGDPVGEGGHAHDQPSAIGWQQFPHIGPGDGTRPESKHRDGEHKGHYHQNVHQPNQQVNSRSIETQHRGYLFP